MMTVEKYFDGFKEHLQNMIPGIQPDLLNRYCRRILAFFKYRADSAQDGPISQITQRYIESYLDSRRSLENHKTNVARRTALQHFFRYLTHVAKVIPTDPTADIRRPEPSDEPALMFTRREVLKMFSVCDMTTENGLRAAVLLIMGAFAGLRVDEICQFNVEPIVEFDDVKRIDLRIMKNRRGAGNRTISLWEKPSASVRALRDLRLKQGAKMKAPLLVSYKKSGERRETPRGDQFGRLTPGACDDIIKKLAELAGINKIPITMTMLRATHAHSLFFIRTYDSARILERLGLKSMNSLDPYAHRVEIHKKYNSLAEYWSDADGGNADRG